MFAKSVKFATTPDPGIPGCFFSASGNVISVLWVVVLGFELLTLCLTAFRGLRHRFGRGNCGTVVTLYWDAFRFSLLLSCISIINLVVAFIAPIPYKTTTVGLQRAMHAVLAGRIILRLRRKASESPETDTFTIVSPSIPRKQEHEIELSTIDGTDVGRCDDKPGNL